MINKDGFCGHCRTYHYPDRRFWNNCPNPFVPVPRAPQPTHEEVHAQRMQALQEKHAAENLVKQREQEKLDRQKTLERAMIQEMMKKVDQQQAAARAAKSAEVKAQQAEAHAWMKARAQIGRLERKLEDRHPRYSRASAEETPSGATDQRRKER
jgi:hypothetical protein